MSAKNNSVYIATPLKDDSLVLTEAEFEETLGAPFTLEAKMISTDETVVFEKLLGKNVTLRYESDDGTRYVNGIVTAFKQLENVKALGQYSATIRPWLWLLSLSKHCRIFQEKSYPDIIKAVFDTMGFSDYKSKLTSKYNKQDYVVQFQETDLDFVTRIMQQEGIYYSFEHTNGKHTLILHDDLTSANTEGSVDYHELDPEANLFDVEGLFNWENAQEIKTSGVKLSSKDFTLPHKNLSALAKVSSSQTFSQLKEYEYQLTYNERKAGDRYAKILMEQHDAQFETKYFSGNIRNLASGSTFKLVGHPRDDQNKLYFITRYEFVARTNAIADEKEDNQKDFSCKGEAIYNKLPFRQQRTVSKPTISGLQTATVVGKNKDQVHTDKYGRIKVHFHWDDNPGKGENTSCWIRVAQTMSGKGWGSLSIPRPGQEVLVDFLQGDPDYPIVVGSVYNGANLPPYDLPKLGHLHGFRSRTSAKTAQVNEIRFDDTYKQEQLYISAAYNYDIMVNNDCFETIGADRHLTVKKDMLCKIGNNQNEDIAADSTVKIGKDSSTNIMGKCISQVGGSRSLVVKGDSGENYEKNLSVKVNKDAYINASNVCIEASNNITFKVGDTYIAMERGGISIKSAGKIAIESKQNLSLESGAKTELSGKSATVIKGKSVKIN